MDRREPLTKMNDKRIITVLSLGGGVQSTALALMAERGIIERPVAAIFADTGDEPMSLDTHLEWLQGQISFPIHKVVEGGGLGRDFLAALCGEKNRASQPPFYVKAADMTPQEIKEAMAEPEPKPYEFKMGEDCEDEECDLDGETLKLASFTRAETEYMVAWHAWKTRRSRAMNKDRGGMLWRACTRDYKIVPVRRKTRELMIAAGAKHVHQMIGISTDERQRENASGVKYITNVHPLLDLGWSRQRCEEWLLQEFGLKVPKSACRYCPYRSNAGWQRMKVEEPQEFELACQYDEAIRASQGQKIRGAGIVGELYVHRSFTPLRTASLEIAPDQMDFGFEQECEGMCGH